MYWWYHLCAGVRPGHIGIGAGKDCPYVVILSDVIVIRGGSRNINTVRLVTIGIIGLLLALHYPLVNGFGFLRVSVVGFSERMIESLYVVDMLSTPFCVLS